MILVPVGPVGVGKGKLSKSLVEKHGGFCIPFGEIIRGEFQCPGDWGIAPLIAEAKQYSDKGELAPDRVICEIFTRCFKNVAGQELIVLDGFPRKMEQTITLEKVVSSTFAKTRLVQIVELYVPKDQERVLEERVRNPDRTKRTDGDAETHRKRMAAYYTHTVPAIERLKKSEVINVVSVRPILALHPPELVLNHAVRRLGLVDRRRLQMS